MKEPEELVTTKIGRKFWIYRDDTFYRQRVANVGPYQKHNLLRLRELVPKARVILDVGMNIGMNAIEYATWAKVVHGFEPTKQTYDMAVKNIKLAKKQQVVRGWHPLPDGTYSSAVVTGEIIPHHVGIGSRSGKFELSRKKNNAGQNFVIDELTYQVIRAGHYKDTEEVEVKTLDSFGFREVDAIKIDVEGFEMKVLLGAVDTIARWKPVVQLEILETHAKRFGVAPQDLYDWFLERGYTISFSNGEDAGTKWKKVSRMMDRFFVHKSKLKR